MILWLLGNIVCGSSGVRDLVMGERTIQSVLCFYREAPSKESLEQQMVWFISCLCLKQPSPAIDEIQDGIDYVIEKGLMKGKEVLEVSLLVHAQHMDFRE